MKYQIRTAVIGTSYQWWKSGEARYFIAVAEELNFGRAAVRLQMSQPPLSAAIKMMERRLGVILLHRTTREVQLTPTGAVFLDHCRTLVATAQAADIAAKQAADGHSGQLRVGAVTSAFTDPLPRSLEAFTASHPNVDVRIRELDTHVAVDLLHRRELDVALIRLLAAPADCERVTLRRDTSCWPCRAHQPGSQRASNTNLFEAAILPWIWLNRRISPDYHDQVAACCRAADFTRRRNTMPTPSPANWRWSHVVSESLSCPKVRRDCMRYTTTSTSSTYRETSTIDLAAVWRRPWSALIDGFLRSIRSAIDPDAISAAEMS